MAPTSGSTLRRSCELIFGGLELIQADDNPLAFLDLPLVTVGAGADLLLDEALFDGGHGAAHAVDLVDVLLGLGLDCVGQILEVIGARQGVDGVAHRRSHRP